MLVSCQRHARFHLAATLAVTGAGFWFHVSRLDWAILVVAMTLVWTAEAFNTAIEKLADAVHPENHPLVGLAKDVAAGAVLIASVASLLLGLLVFMPYLPCQLASLLD